MDIKEQLVLVRESAKEHDMSEEFVNWFIDNKFNPSPNSTFNYLAMSIMWEGWKGAVETALEIMKKD